MRTSSGKTGRDADVVADAVADADADANAAPHPHSRTVPVFERLFRGETAASTSLKQLTPNKVIKVQQMRERERSRSASRNRMINNNDSLDPLDVPFVTRTDEEYEIAVERAIVNWNILLYRNRNRNKNKGNGNGNGNVDENENDTRNRRDDADLQLAKILVSLERCRRWRNARNRMKKTIYINDGYKHNDDHDDNNGNQDESKENNGIATATAKATMNVLKVIDEQMGIQPHELHFHDKEHGQTYEHDHGGFNMDSDMDTDLEIESDMDADGDGDLDGAGGQSKMMKRRGRRRTFHEKIAYKRASRALRNSRMKAMINAHASTCSGTSTRGTGQSSHASTTTLDHNEDDKYDRLRSSRHSHTSRRRARGHTSRLRNNHRHIIAHTNTRRTSRNPTDADADIDVNDNANANASSLRNVDPNPHFHVAKILLSNKYNPTRGWRELSPTALDLVQTLAQFEDGTLDAPAVSCHIISSLFEKDFIPGDEWMIHNARAVNVTRARQRAHQKKKKRMKLKKKKKDSKKNEMMNKKIGENNDNDRDAEEQEHQWQVFRVEKRATWAWNEIQSESVARGDVKFLPHEKEIHIEEYVYFVAGQAAKAAQIFERLFYTDTAASASLKRVKWTHHHHMLPPSQEDKPRVKLSSMMTRDENRMMHAISNEHANGNISESDEPTPPPLLKTSSSATTTTSSLSGGTLTTVTRHYHSTKIQLLMSSKYTHGRGFMSLSLSELGLVQILADFEHSNDEWNQSHRLKDNHNAHRSRSPSRSRSRNDLSVPNSPARSCSSRSVTPHRGRNTNTRSPIQVIPTRRNPPAPNSPMRSPTRHMHALPPPQISSQQTAHAIIDALFKRDFEPGPNWKIDPSTVQKVGPSHTLQRNNPVKDSHRRGDGNSSSNSVATREWGEEVYRAEKQATWDCEDFYYVALAKGTIRFLPRIKEIRVESYTYYVAG